MKRVCFLFLLALIAGRPALNGQPLINGSFETGDLTGWTYSPGGDVFVLDTAGSYTPFVYPFALSTIPILAGANAHGQLVEVSATSLSAPFVGPVDGSSLLNLRGGYLFDFWTDLRWDHNGTTFQLYAFESIKVEQTVHLLAGQGIQFAADYRSSNTLPGTDQQPFNRVWFEMNGVTLWEENTSTAPLVNDQYTTGWITQTFYASEEGDYTLSFYAEREDQFHHFLLLDDIQIVPEPTTFSLVCLGAVVVAMARRKR